VPGPDGCFVAARPADSGGGWLRLCQWIDGVPVDLAACAEISDILARLPTPVLIDQLINLAKPFTN
jgi:hypothetical protein